MAEDHEIPPVILGGTALRIDIRELEKIIFHMPFISLFFSLVLLILSYCIMRNSYMTSQLIDFILFFSTCVICYFIHRYRIHSTFKCLNEQTEKFHGSIKNIYGIGFPLIREQIIHEMNRHATSSSETRQEQQKKCDNHIVAPLEYCNNLISGENNPPKFNPDEPYINLLFERPHVIAITGAPTSMWMDPTLSYFLVNSLLASLIVTVNQQLKERELPCNGGDKNHYSILKTKRRDSYVNDHKSRNKELLVKLADPDGAAFSSKEEFVARFFILDQEDLLRSRTLIESLHALHELFAVQAYFIKKVELDKRLERIGALEKYSKMINRMWAVLDPDTIVDDSEVIKPEFLVFQQMVGEKNDAQVFTYRKEEVYQKYIPESLELIKLIADICKDIPDDDDFWFNPINVNRDNSFVKVEEEGVAVR